MTQEKLTLPPLPYLDEDVFFDDGHDSWGERVIGSAFSKLKVEQLMQEYGRACAESRQAEIDALKADLRTYMDIANKEAAELEAARKRIATVESQRDDALRMVSLMKASAERAEAELADIKESYRETVNEKCSPSDDRVHCSCVPALRAARAEAEALLRECRRTLTNVYPFHATPAILDRIDAYLAGGNK